MILLIDSPVRLGSDNTVRPLSQNQFQARYEQGCAFQEATLHMGKKIIDAMNSFCPGPLMELIAGMKAAAVGDELEVLSTGKWVGQ